MTAFDLDAAYREVAGEAPTFTYGGETFTLPVTLPLPTGEITEEARAKKWDDERFLRVFLSALLGDQWDRFWAKQPTFKHLTVLFDKAMALYGTNLGESSPSASSSKTAGGSSRRKSGGSTKRTPAATSPKVELAS